MPYEELRKLFEQRFETKPTFWQGIELGAITKWAVVGLLCFAAVLLTR